MAIIRIPLHLYCGGSVIYVVAVLVTAGLEAKGFGTFVVCVVVKIRTVVLCLLGGARLSEFFSPE